MLSPQVSCRSEPIASWSHCSEPGCALTGITSQAPKGPRLEIRGFVFDFIPFTYVEQTSGLTLLALCGLCHLFPSLNGLIEVAPCTLHEVSLRLASWPQPRECILGGYGLGRWVFGSQLKLRFEGLCQLDPCNLWKPVTQQNAKS